MAQHDRIAYRELIKGLHEQSRLGCRSPDTRAGPSAVSEAWSVKAQNAMAAGKKVDQPAENQVLHHRAVAMEQHHAGNTGVATVEIMQSHAVAIDEGSDRRVVSLRQPREHQITEDQKNQNDDDNGGDGFNGGHYLSLNDRAQ